MGVCCCSLVGTKACLSCSNNSDIHDFDNYSKKPVVIFIGWEHVKEFIKQEEDKKTR